MYVWCTAKVHRIILLRYDSNGKQVLGFAIDCRWGDNGGAHRKAFTIKFHKQIKSESHSLVENCLDAD